MNNCKVSIYLLLGAAFIATGEGQTLIDLRTQTKSVDFSTAGSTKPIKTGSNLPAACTPGELFFLTSAPAGSNVYGCNPANVWTTAGANLTVNSGTANQVLSSNGSGTQWVALGGDVSGAPGAVAVTRLQGRNVGNAAPADGQVLKWNAASNAWVPAPGQTGNSSFAFASQTAITIPGSVHQFGTANLIVDCYDGSTPAKRVEPDTIQINPATYDVAIAFSAAQTGYCVVNGAGAAGGSGGGTTALAGDLAGNTAAATVTGIQNRAVANTAPSDGQALVWNAAGSAWKPATIAGSGAVASVFGRTGTVAAQAGDYSFAQISGAVGSSQLPAASGDLSGSLSAPTVAKIQSRAVANTAPSDGQALVWNAAGSTWQPGTIAGGVTSVFGRSGAVTAQSGDYSFAQISGTLSGSQLPTGINAANIGPGTVTNTAFGYLANVTSDVQTQLNGKAPLSGDLAGNTVAATVTGIQNRAVSNTAPTDGQALVWSVATSRWQPSNVTGSGGGATMASQLGDFAVVRTSSTVLTIGANCSSTFPCIVRFGYQVFPITTSATATLSGGGIGAAYVYVNASGNIIVGHNLTVACSSGCTQQTGVTSFPPNVIPIYIWTATNGAWDTSGGHDQRAFLSAKTLAGGTGITVSDTPGQTTVTVDLGAIPTYLMNSAVLNFPSIPTGGCSSDLTVSVAGANTGDAVAPGWPAGLPSGILGIMLVSSSNTVSVRLCNLSGSAVQPPSATYRATIVRNY